MANLLHQLYQTKLRLAGLVTAVAGAGLLFIAKAVESDPTWNWLLGWPANALGTTLLSAGIIAVIFEYYARKESRALVVGFGSSSGVDHAADGSSGVVCCCSCWLIRSSRSWRSARVNFHWNGFAVAL